MVFKSAAYIQIHFILLFIIDANNMHPDQTEVCNLEYQQISRQMREQAIKVEIGSKHLKLVGHMASLTNFLSLKLRLFS